ncbi:MAG: GNAT family N-acetyltransferase [Taibaiella sp.]|nr:GNAT family N-acetyltransferase [Taibaiella sp.]
MESNVQATSDDVALVHRLFCELWPNFGNDELLVVAEDILASEDFAVFLCYIDGDCAGFIYMSLRTDYVQGCSTSPTGYIEGIYIRESFRRHGIAGKLLRVGEEWVRSKGCTEVGSDVDHDNYISQSFHTRSGFRQTGHLITFLKRLE